MKNLTPSPMNRMVSEDGVLELQGFSMDNAIMVGVQGTSRFGIPGPQLNELLFWANKIA